MPVTAKVNTELPEYARMTVSLIEKLGFSDWHFEYEHSTPDDITRRVQIRDEKHYAPPADITQLAAAMKRGDDIPPIVVTDDGYIIDGNTRIRAAQRLGFPKLPTIVVHETFDTASDAVRRRLQLLGAAFNARHGRGIDRSEIASAVTAIAVDSRYDATRIAALLGVAERTVRDILTENKARERAEQAGVHVNGSIPASQLRRLGGVSDKVNTEPYTELVKLTQDAGLTVTELGDVITKLRGTQSDEAALLLLDGERKARREQIQEFTATRKSRPSDAAKLRQRLGFIVDHEVNPARLVEKSPNYAAAHRDLIQRAIDILEQIRDQQAEALPSA